MSVTRQLPAKLMFAICSLVAIEIIDFVDKFEWIEMHRQRDEVQTDNGAYANRISWTALNSWFVTIQFHFIRICPQCRVRFLSVAKPFCWGRELKICARFTISLTFQWTSSMNICQSSPRAQLIWFRFGSHTNFPIKFFVTAGRVRGLWGEYK